MNARFFYMLHDTCYYTVYSITNSIYINLFGMIKIFID